MTLKTSESRFSKPMPKNTAKSTTVGTMAKAEKTKAKGMPIPKACMYPDWRLR